MIDIKFLRENPDAVRENIKKKFQDAKLPLVDEVIEYDAKSRAAQQEADQIRADKKKISKQIGILMKQGKKEEALKMYQEIKSKYVNSALVQSQEIDKYIERLSE
jgi:seryl-tRNA synthetase